MPIEKQPGSLGSVFFIMTPAVAHSYCKAANRKTIRIIKICFFYKKPEVAINCCNVNYNNSLTVFCFSLWTRFLIVGIIRPDAIILTKLLQKLFASNKKATYCTIFLLIAYNALLNRRETLSKTLSDIFRLLLQLQKRSSSLTWS